MRHRLLQAVGRLRRGPAAGHRPTLLLQTRCSSQTATPPASENDKYVQLSHYPDIPPVHQTLHEYCLSHFQKHSAKTAMIDHGTGRSMTYGSMIDGIHRWGAVVQQYQKQNGYSKPPTVALFMSNSLDYPAIFFGTVAVGGTLSTMNATYTAAEVARHLADCDAEIFVVEEDKEATALKALQLLQQNKTGSSVPVPKLFVCGASKSGLSDLRTLLADSKAPFATPVEVPMDTIAVLPYSSGTTGPPKGVCISHSALSNCLAMFADENFVEPVDENVNEIVMGLMPMYHIYGILANLCLSLTRGCKIINVAQFTVDSFVDIIKTHKTTHLPLAPPLMKFLVHTDMLGREDLQHVAKIMCGAAPLSKTIVEQIKEKAPNALFQEGYGMTEVGVTHATPIKNFKLGFCGQLIPRIKAKIIDTETGESLPWGQEGELLIKTPAMMTCYHKNPEATRQTIDEQGWLHTGDIATCDEDGYFSIHDRIKELIKVKGSQVSPSELEDVLLGHPGIADVGVVGVPDDRAGELPRAYIVKSSGQEVSEAEIQAFMQEAVSKDKQLAGGIRFVSELPKNNTGKLLRRTLREEAVKDM